MIGTNYDSRSRMSFGINLQAPGLKRVVSDEKALKYMETLLDKPYKSMYGLAEEMFGKKPKVNEIYTQGFFLAAQKKACKIEPLDQLVKININPENENGTGKVIGYFTLETEKDSNPISVSSNSSIFHNSLDHFLNKINELKDMLNTKATK